MENINNKRYDKILRERTFIDEINEYKNKSKLNNFINDNILIINTNVLEGISKNKQSSFVNEYLRYEVKGKDFYIEQEKIIATSKTMGKLKNGHTNFEKNINKILQNEIKINIIANIDNILLISEIYQKDRMDTKCHTFANTFDRRKSIIIYKKQKYEVMFEIGKKDGVNTLYGIESVKKTNKKTYSPKSSL